MFKINLECYLIERMEHLFSEVDRISSEIKEKNSKIMIKKLTDEFFRKLERLNELQLLSINTNNDHCIEQAINNFRKNKNV